MQIYQHPHEEGAILQKSSQGIDTIITFCADFNVIVAFIWPDSIPKKSTYWK